MLNLKKTAVAVLALGSSAVFAGTMGPVCAPGNVTIPCEKTAWDFGAQALYLQPTYTGDFGYRNHVVTAGVGTVIENVEPKWGWGFQIEGSYHFNTGNDLNLNWYHWNKSTTRAWTSTTGTYTGTNYTFEPKWDAVNFEVGQHIDFSDMKNLRLHAGVEYARIHHNLNVVVTSQNVADSVSYNGFGPRVGADLGYDIGNGFGVFANSAASLLIGTAKQGITGYTGANTALNYSLSRTQMAPELEGKLGVNYNYAMAQGDLGLDVGYMWVNYWNTQTVAITGESHDFALNGIFFGAKWVGNVM